MSCLCVVWCSVYTEVIVTVICALKKSTVRTMCHGVHTVK